MAGSDTFCDASADAGGQKRVDELLQSLGNGDWNERQEAVHRLEGHASGDLIEQLLSILRDGHRDLSRLNAAIQVLVRTPADVVPELLELLSDPSADVRTYAALTLGERGDPRAISRLLESLKDSNSNVQMHAVEALGRLRAGAAVDAFIDIVETRDFELAFPALDALIAIGDERVANRLVPLLKESLFKLLAVEALGALGNEEVVKPLLDLLVDADVPPASIVIALRRIHDRYQQRYGDEATVPDTVCSLVSHANVQALTASAQLTSPLAVSSWVKVLGWLPGPDAATALLNLLERPPIDIEVVSALVRKGSHVVPLLLERLSAVTEKGRKAIIETLARLGDRTAVPALLAMLDSDDEELVVRTVDSLARLADPRAYESVRSLLGHHNARVRQSAVAAVNSLGHPHTAADLLSGFQDSSPLVRESSVRVATYLGLPLCIDAVFDCCGDPDERVRRAAIECVPTLDDQRVYQRLSHAIRTDTPAVRAAAAAALAKVDNSEAASILLADALLDGDVWVRYFAVRSLLAIRKQEPAFAALVRLAKEDSAMQVRVVAIEALSGCGSAALAPLVDLAHSTIRDLAHAALLALGGLPGPEPKQAILNASHSEDAEKRWHAIRAMALTSGPDFIEQLRFFALGTDSRLADEATLALSRRGDRESALALLDGASWPYKRDRCVTALATMGDAAVPALAYGLRTRDLDTRRAIVEVLSRIRSAKAIDALGIALEDGQPSVRQAALAALAHIRRTHLSATTAGSCEGKN